MATQQSITQLLLNLIHKRAPEFFPNGLPQEAEPCPICKKEILKSLAFFKCGHAFHVECCRRPLFRSTRCPECHKPINEKIGINEARKEEKLLVFLHELQSDIMDEDVETMSQESPGRLSASGNLRNVCRKLGKNESQNIYCYFEFGKAIVIRLNELLEKGQKKPREKLNQEIHKYFPDGTSLILVKKKIEKARKIYDLFSVIGESKIRRVRLFSIDSISSFTIDELNYIKWCMKGSAFFLIYSNKYIIIWLLITAVHFYLLSLKGNQASRDSQNRGI
ncbi:hypothetical protein Glove_277g10 [Diversispora epigaea]|uniref:RING-type domain-containing protein n=1 Tax=Diversispora epigaea TaxID=1348612 RepID=A0A397I3V4_9GLOM|nr:hypothetical protein Glove_277g10 [Diversispora epigaea]